MKRQAMGRLAALLVLATAAAPAAAQDGALTVKSVDIVDWKAVFATVESQNVNPARTRIGGIVARLAVDEGDRVEAGQLIAIVTDEKLGLQETGATAEVRALEAARANALIELERARKLYEDGFVAKARLETAQTAYDMADNQLSAARAQRSVASVQEREGEVAAPSAGIVLQAPVVEGAVVTPGELIALIAQENYVLRISLPERHARALNEGDPVRVAGAELAGPEDGVADEGRIVRVYPEIREGRVFADAYVEGLGDYFVGQRVRVLVGAENRKAITVPASYIATRFGIDFLTVETEGGARREVVVQRGRATPAAEGEEEIEILSGISEGDVLVKP
jgi:RND family efflux transporter MFP subunit